MIQRILTILVLVFLLGGLPSTAQNKLEAKFGKKPTPVQPGTPKYYDQQVRKLFKDEKWEEGRKLLEVVLEKYPWLSGLNELMGQYWLRLKSYDKARFYLLRSIRDDKGNINSLQMLMKLEESTRHYSTAIVYCNELLENTPYDYTLWRKKIELFRLEGNLPEASRLLKRLDEIYPNDPNIRKERIWDMEQRYDDFKKKKDLKAQEEVLREIVKYAPEREDFQLAFCNLLLQSGRYMEAIDAAGYAAMKVKDKCQFVVKKASILCELQRYAEAKAYLTMMMKELKSSSDREKVENMLDNVELEVAQAASDSDPYVAFSKLYEKNHSNEILNYLISTSMARGYFDDALEHIHKARKIHGDTQELLYKEYTVQHRLGNKKAATNMLERIHRNWPDNRDVNEELCNIYLDDVDRLMMNGQYYDALGLLENMADYEVDSEIKDAIDQKLYTCYVKTGQKQKALQQLEINKRLYAPEIYTYHKANLFVMFGRQEAALHLLQVASEEGENISYEMYEEIALPYIKQLIEERRIYQADVQIAKAMEIDTPSEDMLAKAVNVSLLLDKKEQARKYINQGMALYPANPYFIVKNAQLLAEVEDYERALALLRPMLDTYMMDSTIINAYAGCCESLALRYLSKRQYDSALGLVDEALQVSPDSQELTLVKAQVLEGKKEWEYALETYRLYHPPIAEVKEYQRHLEEIRRHQLRNQVNIDYLMVRNSTSAAITSTMLIDYTRYAKNNTYTVGLGYAGRDASEDGDQWDEGGNAVQLNLAWGHTWNKKIDSNIYGGVANKIFPSFKVGGNVNYHLPDSWIATGKLSFRRVGTRVKNSLLTAGLGANKDISHFNVGGEISLTLLGGDETEYLNGTLFANGSVTAKFFPTESDRSHMFLSVNYGNAPDMSFIDASMPMRFNQQSMMFSMGGVYFVNSLIDVALTGSWYNIAVMSVGSPLLNNYKNYLYLNANVTVHF